MSNKILLIEDDDFMREMIALVLESEDYEVTGVGNGADALQALAEGTAYNAVISDMYLPDTDGLKLFAEVNVNYPGLLFLILTSETDQLIVKKATDLGINYILKDENFAESILAVLNK